MPFPSHNRPDSLCRDEPQSELQYQAHSVDALKCHQLHIADVMSSPHSVVVVVRVEIIIQLLIKLYKC